MTLLALLNARKLNAPITTADLAAMMPCDPKILKRVLAGNEPLGTAMVVALVKALGLVLDWGRLEVPDGVAGKPE